MKYYMIYENNGSWQIYEITDYGQHYRLFKTFKTKKGVENWAKKQWHEVQWR